MSCDGIGSGIIATLLGELFEASALFGCGCVLTFGSIMGHLWLLPIKEKCASGGLTYSADLKEERVVHSVFIGGLLRGQTSDGLT
jgi:hypothetical protein